MNEATRKLMFSSETDVWATPQTLFDELNETYGPFDLDVCALPENAKCSNYLTPEVDGLQENWKVLLEFKGWGSRCFMNPPYGRHNGGIGAWVKKAKEESDKGCLVCCLLPVRTDTAWFHDYVLSASRERRATVRFLRGRVKFGGATSGAPFPSMVVVFYPPKEKA